MWLQAAHRELVSGQDESEQSYNQYVHVRCFPNRATRISERDVRAQLGSRPVSRRTGGAEYELDQLRRSPARDLTDTMMIE